MTIGAAQLIRTFRPTYEFADGELEDLVCESVMPAGPGTGDLNIERTGVSTVVMIWSGVSQAATGV